MLTWMVADILCEANWATKLAIGIIVLLHLPEKLSAEDC